MKEEEEKKKEEEERKGRQKRRKRKGMLRGEDPLMALAPFSFEHSREQFEDLDRLPPGTAPLS